MKNWRMRGVLAFLGLCALLGVVGCGGGNSLPSPEIQEQNIQDELKAMENAENSPGI